MIFQPLSHYHYQLPPLIPLLFPLPAAYFLYGHIFKFALL